MSVKVLRVQSRVAPVPITFAVGKGGTYGKNNCCRSGEMWCMQYM